MKPRNGPRVHVRLRGPSWERTWHAEVRTYRDGSIIRVRAVNLLGYRSMRAATQAGLRELPVALRRWQITRQLEEARATVRAAREVRATFEEVVSDVFACICPPDRDEHLDACTIVTGRPS